MEWQRTASRTCRELVSGLLDLVYPPRCLVCNRWLSQGALCGACVADIVVLEPPFCHRCGVPIGEGHRLCEPCEAGEVPPFAWSQTLGRYGGRLRDAIHRFKYDGKTALALPLGKLLADSLDAPPSPLLRSSQGESLTFDVVVPVPLHPARYRQRGFNQSELLAKIVAQQRGWLLDTQGLQRVRRTRPQANLVRTDRVHNVLDAFTCQPLQRYAGKSVLIIDDVLTTGSTMREVARTIQEAGAERVCIVALARG